ncbi:hypothetical protein IJM86_07610 [bacterium]|nr:hypothetical protein [bacterium]
MINFLKISIVIIMIGDSLLSFLFAVDEEGGLNIDEKSSYSYLENVNDSFPQENSSFVENNEGEDYFFE